MERSYCRKNIGTVVKEVLKTLLHHSALSSVIEYNLLSNDALSRRIDGMDVDA